MYFGAIVFAAYAAGAAGCVGGLYSALVYTGINHRSIVGVVFPASVHVSHYAAKIDIRQSANNVGLVGRIVYTGVKTRRAHDTADVRFFGGGNYATFVSTPRHGLPVVACYTADTCADSAGYISLVDAPPDRASACYRSGYTAYSAPAVGKHDTGIGAAVNRGR